MNLRLKLAAITASLALLAVVIAGEQMKGTDNGASQGRLDMGGAGPRQDGNAGADSNMAPPRTGKDVHTNIERVLPLLAPAVPRREGVVHARGVCESVSIGQRRLCDAIRQVESGGNDRAVGDAGASVGPYQCGIAAWIDGGGKAADYPRLAYDRAATEKVMIRYWARYGAKTDEERARCWNSGSRWKSKYHLTNNYWEKVKQEIEWD